MSESERIAQLEKQVVALEVALRLNGIHIDAPSQPFEEFIMEIVRARLNINMPDHEVGQTLYSARQHILDNKEIIQTRVNQIRTEGGIIY